MASGGSVASSQRYRCHGDRGRNEGMFLSNFFAVLWRIVKWFLRVVTGKCEIERKLGSVSHTSSLTLVFADCLAKSKQLGGVAKLVFSANNEIFAPARLADAVLRIKNIPAFNSRAGPNVKACLVDLNGVCAAIEAIRRIRDTRFDSSNASHESRLENVWNGLRPGVRRRGGRLSLDWQEIGFQGEDPATDFRGMGLLGLMNLEYLACEQRDIASYVLARQATHGLFFAITGINVTAYVMNLLEARHLDAFFYTSVLRKKGEAASMMNGDDNDDAPSSLSAMELSALRTFHQIYTQMFWRLATFWENAGQADIMAFTSVFLAFQPQVERELLAGTVTLNK